MLLATNMDSQQGVTTDDSTRNQAGEVELKFGVSDIGMACWEHPEEGWATECDRDRISDEFRAAIEAHPEFDCWKERCAGGCGADDEHCDCDDHYCEEDDCEKCRRGIYCDCCDARCPYCSPHGRDGEEEDEADSEKDSEEEDE